MSLGGPRNEGPSMEEDQGQGKTQKKRTKGGLVEDSAFCSQCVKGCRFGKRLG